MAHSVALNPFCQGLLIKGEAEIAGGKVKVFLFVATLGYSRRLHVRAFRNERQESWFAGLESAFARFGGVTDEVLFDNARALVVDHDAVTRSVVFNDRLLAFAKHWGFRPRACASYRARTKGKTENGGGYVKKNAIAGRLFATWEALEAHLDSWTREVAEVRIHGTTGETPISRFVRAEAKVVLVFIFIGMAYAQQAQQTTFRDSRGSTTGTAQTDSQAAVSARPYSSLWHWQMKAERG